MQMDVNTPAKSEGSPCIVTTSFFLTPSAKNICILCHEDITQKYANDKDKSNKKRLWTDDMRKTLICQKLEKLIGESIDPKTDFASICRACSKAIENASKKQESKESMVQEGRALITEKYLRTLSSRKRLAKSDPLHPSKKQLTFYDQAGQSSSTRKIRLIFDQQKEEELCITENMYKVINFLVSNKINKALETLQQLCGDSMGMYVKSYVENAISNEVSSICSYGSSTSFRVKDIKELDKITFKVQYEELKARAPLLSHVLLNAAFNPRADVRNKIKTSDTLIPSIVNVAGILFHCRNKSMNCTPSRNMLILRNGKADKRCYDRLNKLNVCESHTSILRKQFEMTKDIESDVIAMADQLSINAEGMRKKILCALKNEEEELPMHVEQHQYSIENEKMEGSFFDQAAVNPTFIELDYDKNYLSDVSSQGSSQAGARQEDDIKTSQKISEEIGIEVQSIDPYILPLSFDSKFVFVGDNVDIVIKPNQYMIGKGNRDIHMYNMIAVENRIKIPDELIGVKCEPNRNVEKLPLCHILPTIDDELALKEEVKVLLSRDLVKYFESVKWMKKDVVTHIPHKYSEDVCKVSNVFPLGIIDQNETTTEGMIEIMKHQHKLVPGDGTETLLRMLSVGDLLTVERQQNAQRDKKDGATPSKRLEGLIPALADFHSYGNFLEVIWHILYNASSGTNKGTLFQARNFLDARGVPGRPMSNLNACEDLLFKYSDALLVSMFTHYTSTHDVSSTDDEASNKQKMDNILNDLVDVYILPEVTLLEKVTDKQKNAYQCCFCEKSFKRKSSLEKHVKMHPAGSQNVSEEDCVLNYSKTALALTYLAKDFVDARRHGDGERIIRLYKFLLLYFKVDSRTKYAYQSLHLLAQVSILLPPALSHEITWNRFVNTKGHIDSNVELDRHLEHHNRFVKEELHRYQGKLTEKSIARCGRSYNFIKCVIDSMDKELHLSKPSGRHTQVDATKDIMLLADQFVDADLFSNHPGRFHSSFPGFPKNYLELLNIAELKKWIRLKLKEFKGMKIYKISDITT